MAGTIVVDRIESDASYTSTINVAGQITFSNTVNFGVFAGTAPVAGFYLPTTNNLAFTTASTERMRLDSNGNLFLGATTSASNSTKLLSYATADQSAITINATNASQTNDVALIRNTRNTTNGTYNALAVYNDGAAAYRFKLTDGGNIGLFGGQIAFPATQNASADANTLDDYEEGTWTPALTFGGGSTGLTYNNRYGWYTKIGNQIYIQVLIYLSSIGSSTGDVLISGLPFISTADSFKRNGGYGFFDRCTPANVLGVQNSTTFQLQTISSGPASSSVPLTQSNMANNAYISASFIYLI